MSRHAHDLLDQRTSFEGKAWMLAIVLLAALALGLYLARFSVFAVLIATTCSAAAAFIFNITQDSTLPHSVLVALVTAFVLQVGYLLGQVLRPSRK
jgi:Na+-transporting NADH:ubiquinone oxidoreductase subunit NqrE